MDILLFILFILFLTIIGVGELHPFIEYFKYLSVSPKKFFNDYKIKKSG